MNQLGQFTTALNPVERAAWHNNTVICDIILSSNIIYNDEFF